MLRLSEDPSVPVHGWRCIDANDLGRRSGQCEMCGGAIRYVHVMEHLHYRRRVKVGVDCAEQMCGGSLGADRDQFRRRASLRARWLSRKWKKTGDGWPYVINHGIRVALFPRRSSGRGKKRLWGYRVGQTLSRRSYASTKEAALAALDVLWKQINKGSE